VKRSVKSHLKLYTQEVNSGKVERAELREQIKKVDRGMQDYMASQLKPLWLLVQGTKHKLERIED